MSMSKGGFSPAASVELGASGGERQDRTPPSRSPQPFVRVDELGGQISGNALARLSPGTKTGFEGEIGFEGFEHLVVPSSPSAATTKVCRDDRICRQSKCQKSGRERIP